MEMIEVGRKKIERRKSIEVGVSKVKEVNYSTQRKTWGLRWRCDE